MPVASDSSCFNTSIDVWQAKDSDVLVDGCLFEGNYANDKGGAINHEDKHISVLGSVFYNNSVGSESKEESEWCHARDSERLAPSSLRLRPRLAVSIPHQTTDVDNRVLLFDRMNIGARRDIIVNNK